MDYMSAEEARRNFADLLNEVRYQGKQIIITRHGKPVAKLVPLDDTDTSEQRQSKTSG